MRAGQFVYLSDYFGADGAATGGAGIASLQSFQALSTMGARVRLVAGYFAPDDIRRRADVQVLGGEDLRAAGRGEALRALYNSEAARRLSPVLAELDPKTTIIVLHQWTRWLSPAALGLLAPFKLMIYMHDYFWLCPNGAYYNFPAERPCTLKPMGARCLATACDRAGYGTKLAKAARQGVKALTSHGARSDRLMLHISDASRRIGQRLAANERHVVVNNPLPETFMEPAVDKNTSVVDVAYFGRLEPEKGVADLCDAVNRLGLSSVFVGSGSMATKLRSSLGEGSVIDWADHARALRLMQRCRVIVLPSRWPETWGLVIAEAMALGRKVVVSKRAGSASLVERFGGGAVYDPDTPGALEGALTAILATPSSDGATAITSSNVRSALSGEKHGRQLISLAADLWDVDVFAGAIEPHAPGFASPPASTVSTR